MIPVGTLKSVDKFIHHFTNEGIQDLWSVESHQSNGVGDFSQDLVSSNRIQPPVRDAIVECKGSMYSPRFRTAA